MSEGFRRWRRGMEDLHIARCLPDRQKRYLREESSSGSNNNLDKTKSDTNSFDEIACRHNQNIPTVLELVKLGEQSIDNLCLFQRI